jgi:hypothetical protein
MDELGPECCPICYRKYSHIVKPMISLCGHTFCQDCIRGFFACPLCRFKIPERFKQITNFSLLSLVEKQAGEIERENRDPNIFQHEHAAQMNDTDQVQRTIVPVRRPSRPRQPKKTIKMKMVRGTDGVLDCLEFVLN